MYIAPSLNRLICQQHHNREREREHTNQTYTTIYQQIDCIINMINHVSYTIENFFYSTDYLYNEQFDDLHLSLCN